MDDKEIFIGKHAIVSDAPNKSLIGLKGIIVNETKNTFVFKQVDSKKMVLKQNLMICINGVHHQINAKHIVERIKSR